MSYSPIYNYFNIENLSKIQKINKQISYNLYLCVDTSNNEVELFYKSIPLVDYVKLIIGKYNSCDITRLPSIDSSHVDKFDKYINSIHNYAYVDSFFYYLTNKIDFIHNVKIYESNIELKPNCEINIVDDIEYVMESSFFLKNLNKLFKFKDPDMEIILGLKKKPIKLYDDISGNITLDEENYFDLSFSENFNLGQNDDITYNILLGDKVKESDEDDDDDDEVDVELSSSDDELKIELYKATYTVKNENNIEKNKENDKNDENDENESEEYETEVENIDNNSVYDNSDDSEDSDDSDYNSDDEEDDDEDNDTVTTEELSSLNSDTEYETESDDSSSDVSSSSSDSNNLFDEDEELKIVFDELPTQNILIEKCEETLDNLLSNDMSIKHLTSAMFQVIAILDTYQHLFDFTHNDLHTNNIMYINTDKQFLCYHINGKTFKVPTYGRIYKIIDFGRAIYKYRNERICSDSFSVNGTARGQYNCYPFENKKLKNVEPNKSFDLCRLGCSIVGYICDDFSDIDRYTEAIPTYKMIVEWLYDDKGKNILYMSNGEERYPDFKLYKMISRKVHNHIPYKQYDNICFKNYICDNYVYDTNDIIVDLDYIKNKDVL